MKILCGFRRCRRQVVRPEPPEDPKILLQSLEIECVVFKSVARVSLKQSFRNKLKTPIECEYVFPRDKKSVISSMIFHIGKSSVEAVIHEIDDAKEMYSDAVSDGKTAFMAEERSEDEMTLNVGNIPPGARIEAEVNYILPLQGKSGKYKLIFPAAMFPVHKLPSNKKTTTCSVDISVSLSPGTIEIESSSHLIHTEVLENGYIVCKSDQNLQSSADFELEFRDSESYQANVIYQRFGNFYYSMLSLLPVFSDGNIEDIEIKGDFIFVIDRSGSMNGKKIKMARMACCLFLKSLPKDSKFNVFSFGDTFKSLFPKSVKYTNENMSLAISKIEKMNANLGGTDIYRPLAKIFSTAASSVYPRSIFLLTDGAVRNPQEVIEIIGHNTMNTRVHSFGIGKDVSRPLVENSATAGGGVCTFVQDEGLLMSSVIKVLEMCQTPSFTDWVIGKVPNIAPKTVKVLLYNEILRIFAKTERPLTDFPEISGVNSLTELRVNFRVDSIQEIPSGDDLARLWAKHYIADLDMNAKNRADVIRLSQEYGIITKYTAFFGALQNSRAVSGNVKFVKIQRQIVKKAKMTTCARGRAKAKICAKKSTCRSRSRSLDMKAGDSDEEFIKAKPKDLKYMELVNKQTIEGTWEFSVVLKFINKAIDLPAELSETAWATILSLAILEKYYSDSRIEWTLVYKKSMRWLKTQSLDDSYFKLAHSLV